MSELTRMRKRIAELERRDLLRMEEYVDACKVIDDLSTSRKAAEAKLEIAIKALTMLRDTPTNNDMALVCAEEARKALEEMEE